jgi:hypothetical protein
MPDGQINARRQLLLESEKAADKKQKAFGKDAEGF